MKKPIIHLLVLIILLVSCNQTQLEPTDPDSFIMPDPETYVMLMPAVREYFYYRKQAVISGEMDTFWSLYPNLKQDTDLSLGINTESSLVRSMQGLKPFDGNILPEYYEKIKVKSNGSEIQVLIHGMELYVWNNIPYQFDDSGGEFKIVLYLLEHSGGWTVTKTDEVTLAEWHDFTP